MKEQEIAEYGIRIEYEGGVYWFEGWSETIQAPIVSSHKTPSLIIPKNKRRHDRPEWRKIYAIRAKHPELFGHIWPEEIDWKE